MNDLVLSAERARQVAAARGSLRVCTESGEVLGFFEPVSVAELQDIDDIKLRLGRPHRSYSVGELLKRLHSANGA
jgi:hypothetical protein